MFKPLKRAKNGKTRKIDNYSYMHRYFIFYLIPIGANNLENEEVINFLITGIRKYPKFTDWVPENWRVLIIFQNFENI